MNKLIRLSPTGIEYGDYAWNFASGCGNNTDGKCNSGGFNCWAHSITQRFAGRYPNGFNPTIYPEALLSPLYLKKPSRILCAFMGDLFWNCPEFDPEQIVTPNLPDPIPSVCFTLHGTLRQVLFGVMRACPQHIFLFLTKQPQNLIKFSPFPDNCWVGVSVDISTPNIETDMLNKAMMSMSQVEAKLKFLSFEPLLNWYFEEGCLNLPECFDDMGIGWVIIGAQTNPYKPPKLAWVEEIIEACCKAKIPYFLKDNLGFIIPGHSQGDKLRQEMPAGRLIR